MEYRAIIKGRTQLSAMDWLSEEVDADKFYLTNVEIFNRSKNRWEKSKQVHFSDHIDAIHFKMMGF